VHDPLTSDKKGVCLPYTRLLREPFLFVLNFVFGPEALVAGWERSILLHSCPSLAIRERQFVADFTVCPGTRLWRCSGDER